MGVHLDCLMGVCLEEGYKQEGSLGGLWEFVLRS